MGKRVANMVLLGAIGLSLAFAGCGGSHGGSAGTSSTAATVSGVATTDAAVNGTVSLKDSSIPAQVRTATTSTTGAYTFDTTGLKAPYVLMSESTGSSGTSHMYSVAEDNGRTNINPITDVAVAAASDNNDAAALYRDSDSERNTRTSRNFQTIINELKDVLAPLYAMYQTSNPVQGDDREDDDGNSWLQAMFKDVSFVIHSGNIVVTNKSTGGIIYEAPLSNITSGTFHSENLPGSPTTPPSACTYSYSAWSTCDQTGTQTRTVLSSSPAGCTGTPVLSQSCTYTPPPTTCAYTYSDWGVCQSNNMQSRTVLTSSPAGCTGTPVLTQPCIYVPPVTTCTSFAYSAWGACQSNNTQTRTVTSSSPAGCTGGSPVLSQACTYVPPTLDGAALYAQYCSGCHGPLASSSKSGRTSAQIQSAIASNRGGMGSLSSLTTAQIDAIAAALAPAAPATCTSFTYSAWGACDPSGTQTRTVTSSSPAGCTGGSPVLSQACTYVPPVTTCTSFAYSAWSTCDPSGTQTRTVTSSSPAGCTGGSPILSQACTYVPPTCTSFTYSAWSACDPSGTQTRTLASSSPAGCTGGSPVLSQACTYVPPAPVITNANVTASCTSCHGLTVNTTVFRSGGYTVTGRNAANWLTSVNRMVGYGASLTPAGVTAQDYANYLSTVP